MAAKKKTKPARRTTTKMAHTGADKEHGGVIVTIEVGPITRTPRRKGRKKATPKQVKAFLKWALTQL